MPFQGRSFLFQLITLTLCLSSIANADDESLENLRKLGENYVAAFNQKDAQAVAAFWSADAIYTNRLSGEQVNGQDAIARQFAELFSTEKDLKLDVEVVSLEFLSPNVAIEKGVATFVSETPEQIPYSLVYVRHGGKWMIDRVTDDPALAVASHHTHLKPLEWMIGSWVDEHEQGAVHADCNWTKNKNFITRSFTVSIEDRIDLSGIQIIGWDAKDEQIRSWTFDSDGGFAEAKWTNDDDEWYVMKKGRTHDGKTVSAVNVIKLVDDDSFLLKSVQRTIDGQLLPDVSEVMVVRQ